MENIFLEKTPGKDTDKQLAISAKGGNREAMDTLISRHRDWIYNIAFRMTGNIADAEDITQEILVKIITRLATFEGHSAFRTWVYRIVKNHVLNMKRSAGERIFESFSAHEELLHRASNKAANSLADTVVSEVPSVEDSRLVQETRALCCAGMLLCLDRQQRLVFALGAIFDVSSDVGAEIMETTAVNFRKLLSRARHQLLNYMNGKCSLINPQNKCSCARKTRAAIAAGFVDRDKLVFTDARQQKVRDIIKSHPRDVPASISRCIENLYREHPFIKSPKYAELLNIGAE
ncbi:MAG: RNA polymerase sigma factor [Deltaproteobacteria bacterium]|nr:RNA polymerase sigma factor [Deltaproteobacteria bacterium]